MLTLTTNYKNKWYQMISNVKKKKKRLKTNFVHCWQILSNIMQRDKLGYSNLIWESIVTAKPEYAQTLFFLLVLSHFMLTYK